MSISAVVLTKDSSKTIEACLTSVSWCDEIIVIDDNSIDATVSIARKAGARIFVHALENDFSRQRNFGLAKATGDWILFVDSDEILSSSLMEEIESRINYKKSNVQGYYVQRIDTMWGKKLLHGELGDIWLLRFAKKTVGKWQGNVHETWHIKGETGKLKNTLEHFPHPSISEFLTRINMYSSLRAQELFAQHVHVSWIDIVVYPKMKFFVAYVFKRGFLDGIPGFLVAISMSFHSFLVRGKLWQLQNAHQ